MVSNSMVCALRSAPTETSHRLTAISGRELSLFGCCGKSWELCVRGLFSEALPGQSALFGVLARNVYYDPS